jgi:TRAP-type C4-dicarboxylate transport system permease small subunit
MSFKGEVMEKTAALMTAAFGLVAALAWNQAIIAIMKEVFGDEWEGIPQMLSYAIIVTIIAVIAIVLIARSAAKYKE